MAAGLRIERAHVYTHRFGRAARGIQKMLTIRQKSREPMGRLTPLGIHLRHRHWRPATGCDLEERRAAVRRKDDDALTIPGTSKAVRGIADHLGWTARGLNLFQAMFGEESDECAVGRPERQPRIFGSGQRARRRLVERTNPEHAA